MRVTHSMTTGNFIHNLHLNLNKLDGTQRRLSSGKKVNRPADDPAALAQSMKLRSNLAGLEQYQKNTDDALSWLENTDSALKNATEVLHRGKELAVKGAGGTLSKQSLQALSKEAGQLGEELRQITNSYIGGRFLFSGSNTDTPPYDNRGQYRGSTNQRRLEIGIGIVVPYSVTGIRTFGEEGGEVDMLGSFFRLEESLEENDQAVLFQLMDELDGALDHLLDMRAEVGARMKRMELVKNRLLEDNLNMTTLLSEKEDADIAETIIELKTQENIYRSALSAGARIIQPGLIDYLR